jgi:hypothetical protein
VGDELLTRLLSINISNLGLEYKQGEAQPGSGAPESIIREFPPGMLGRELDKFLDGLASVMDRTGAGRTIDLETLAINLGNKVLPSPDGFAAVLDPSIHPRMDMTIPEIAALPWEAFEEKYAVCENPKCASRGQVIHSRYITNIPTGAPQAGVCDACATPRRLVKEKLGLSRHLTQLVRGVATGRRTGGHEFLMVIDPQSNLCVDAQGLCERHVGDIEKLLESAGYSVIFIRNEQATTVQILEAMQKQTVVGMYYFGHGEIGEDGQGRLLMHDGPLFAEEILALTSVPRFVLLNACYGANPGRDRKQSRHKGVAHAFAAQGKDNIVIAPLCPVFNTDAAQVAVTVLSEALKGRRLSEALQTARRQSLERYRAGQPDVCWAALRYFGEPGQTLSKPPGKPKKPSGKGKGRAESKSATTRQRTAAPGGRVFGEDDRLNLDAFAFAIDEVLLRSAKRRNFQNRQFVTCTDLLAGLIRKAELLRLALENLHAVPDEIYEKIVNSLEEGPQAAPIPEPAPASPAEAAPAADSAAASADAGGDAGAAPSADPTENPAERDRWIIRGRAQFEEAAVKILLDADALAVGNSSEGQSPPITELDMVLSLIDSGAWPKFPGLPSGEDVRRCISELGKSAVVDNNGRIHLTDLDRRARKVIEIAHLLAQQYGMFPIPNRVVLAAFLIDDRGTAAKLCNEHKLNPTRLCALLLSAAEGADPRTFTLGVKACSRVITPMLSRARKLSGAENVSEEILFLAFREVAPPGLVSLLETPPPEDGLNLEQFEPDVHTLLNNAAGWARTQGGNVIRQPHLFASLIGDATGPASKVLRRADLDPETTKILLLQLVPPQQPAKPTVNAKQKIGLSQTCADILRHAVKFAQQRGVERATQEDVLRAFFVKEDGGIVGQALHKLGMAKLPDADDFYMN